MLGRAVGFMAKKKKFVRKEIPEGDFSWSVRINGRTIYKEMHDEFLTLTEQDIKVVEKVRSVLSKAFKEAQKLLKDGKKDE